MFTNFKSESTNARDHSEDLGTDWRIILKWILEKYAMRVCIGFIWFTTEFIVGILRILRFIRRLCFIGQQSNRSLGLYMLRRLPETESAFSLPGKRLCAGETFARHFMFLILSALLQNFTVKGAPGKPKPSTDPDLPGVIVTKKDMWVRFEPRT
jgi:hypothetical protein